MTDIFIDGKIVDLSANFSMGLEMENPVFSETGFSEGKAFQFSLETTPNNVRIITKKVMSMECYVEGVLLLAGEVHVKNRTEVFLLNFISKDTAVRKQLEDLPNFPEFEYDVINVCGSVAVSAKQITWKNYIDTNLAGNGDPRFFFPQIATKGYREINFSDIKFDDAIWMNANENRINAITENGFLSNASYPSSDTRKFWANSIAPCPKIKWLLEIVLEQLHIVLIKNELEEIEEYQQLFCFNNRSMDNFETFGSSKINNYGDQIDLKKHVPNVSCIYVFNLLREIFDCYFVFEGNKLQILLSKNAIEKKIKNLSSFLIDQKNDEAVEKEAFKFIYPIDEKDKLKKNYTDPNNFVLTLADRTYPTDETEQNEIKKTHVPFYSGYGFQEGFLSTYSLFQAYENNTLVDSNKTGYGELQSLMVSNEYLVSDEFPDEENPIFDTLKIGLFRGAALTGKQHPSTGNTYVNHWYSYSLKKVITFFSAIFTNLPSFGNSSIFHSGPDNAFDLYKSKRIDKSNGKFRKERTYTLPIYELKNILNFKNTRHIIQHESESFTGYVKVVKFEITKMGLGLVTIEYFVDSQTDFIINKRQWIVAE